MNPSIEEIQEVLKIFLDSELQDLRLEIGNVRLAVSKSGAPAATRIAPFHHCVLFDPSFAPSAMQNLPPSRGRVPERGARRTFRLTAGEEICSREGPPIGDRSLAGLEDECV